jgi:hypothetical protein
MNGAGTRACGIEAGAIAGIAGFVAFLVLHHVWIAPIWFIAPVGAVMATVGGAAVGVAYFELLPSLPRWPWTALSVMAVVAAILAPAMVVAEIRGPIYAIGPGGQATLLVPTVDAVVAFGVGLLATATLTGALLGALLGRSRSAAARTALAGFALALGPGHNIPFLGGTSSTTKELAILVAVAAVASFALVESHSLLAGRTDAWARWWRPGP